MSQAAHDRHGLILLSISPLSCKELVVLRPHISWDLKNMQGNSIYTYTVAMHITELTLANFHEDVGQWILSSSFAPRHKKVTIVVQCVIAPFFQLETSVGSLDGFIRGISTTVILHLVDVL